MPPHVTVLYPFLPAAKLAPAVRQMLAAIAGGVAPFDVRFARLGRFPGVVYLAPEPDSTISALTRAIHALFPDYPPYEGAFKEVIPHLTITEARDPEIDEAMLRSVAAEAARDLPFRVRIERLEVIVEGADGRWRGGWRLALGTQGG